MLSLHTRHLEVAALPGCLGHDLLCASNLTVDGLAHQTRYITRQLHPIILEQILFSADSIVTQCCLLHRKLHLLLAGRIVLIGFDSQTVFRILVHLLPSGCTQIFLDFFLGYYLILAGKDV